MRLSTRACLAPLFGVIALALWTPSAHAAEMQPNNVDAPSLIRGGATGGAWYAIPAGGALTFDVIGPAALTVEIVQRLPQDAPGPRGQVKAKGDGMDILTVKIDGDPGQGVIMDGQGGTPSIVGRATINVPAGEHVFSLEPVSGSLAMLARVDAPEGAIPARVLAATDAVAEPVIEEIVEPAVAAVEPAAVEPAAVEPAAEPVVVSLFTEEPEDEPQDEPASEPEPLPAEPEPVPVEPEPTYEPSALQPAAADTASAQPYEPDLGPSTAAAQGLWVGARTGLGGARAGNQASLYLGLEVLYGLEMPGLFVGARLGRYGIGLEQELAIQPPIGGTATTQTVDWKTRVRPLELGARYSFQLGSMEPYLWGALATYSSTRLVQDTKLRGLSLGTSWALGLDFDIGNGVLSPELALNLGSRDFGNLDPDGDAAREKLSGSRVNVAYRIAF